MTRKVLQGLFLFHQITQGIWPQPLACEKAQNWFSQLDYRSRFGSKKEWGFSETSLLGADQRSGVFFLSLLKELATDIPSLEQFDSATPKKLNQNLFTILLLKITIIHWLMHAVTMKWESLHKKNISEVLISLWGQNLLFILLMNAMFIAEILFTLYFNEMFWH